MNPFVTDAFLDAIPIARALEPELRKSADGNDAIAIMILVHLMATTLGASPIPENEMEKTFRWIDRAIRESTQCAITAAKESGLRQ